MSLFSNRQGLKPMQKVVQKESIDQELRNGLWSALYELIYKKGGRPNYGIATQDSEVIENLFFHYWINHFKLPSDNRPAYDSALNHVREIYFNAPWHEVYDFIEFTAKKCGHFSADFTSVCNHILEKENSAYRFVDNEIIEITSETEIKEIEQAINDGPQVIKVHLNTALGLLSDRKKPDYRNSIKESISAVEALCKLLSKDEKSTLAPALKKISDKAPFHPAFQEGLLKLYGFTSDGQGIRHALMEESSLTYADAKFMLILCSGFCNFLLAKCAENGIRINAG
jgi:hypothetical protein